MASAGPSPHSGRRKSLDAELNLVPFIDLLSMCICFLLMTAVWVETGALEVKQAVGSDAAPKTEAFTEIEFKFLSPNSAAFSIRHPDKSTETANLVGETADSMLLDLRKRVAALSLRLSPSGDKAIVGKAVSAARLTTAQTVSFGELISAMDAFREYGIVSIGVAPSKER